MTINHTSILDAIAFAARAHQGQLRKDKETPYVSHVYRVAMTVRHLFGFDDPRMLVAAVLHDTIEDTKTDFDDVEEHFGREIAEWVGYLTKNKALAEKEREADYIKRLTSGPWQVHACKLADVYDNLSDMPNMPAERRVHTLKRTEMYVDAIKAVAAPQLQEPLKMLAKLIERRKKGK